MVLYRELCTMCFPERCTYISGSPIFRPLRYLITSQLNFIKITYLDLIDLMMLQMFPLALVWIRTLLDICQFHSWCMVLQILRFEAISVVANCMVLHTVLNQLQVISNLN